MSKKAIKKAHKKKLPGCSAVPDETFTMMPFCRCFMSLTSSRVIIVTDAMFVRSIDQITSSGTCPSVSGCSYICPTLFTIFNDALNENIIHFIRNMTTYALQTICTIIIDSSPIITRNQMRGQMKTSPKKPP